MKINYLILAHKNPIQLKRLIDKLRDDNCYFFIHVDKSTDITAFHQEIKESNTIRFVPDEMRVLVRWGDISQVNATLVLLQIATQSNEPGYCILLSGQDYPLRNNETIRNFLVENSGKEFVNNTPFPNPAWGKEGHKRLTHYKIYFSKNKKEFFVYPTVYNQEFYTRENWVNIKKLFRHLKFKALIHLFIKRKSPVNIQPFCGSQWWCISTACAKKVVKFVVDHPGYLHYHKYTLIADEIFFHSIIAHLYKDKLQLIYQTFTYVNWEKPHVTLPVTFTAEDFQLLKSLPPEALFARKFDLDIDETILNKIDEELLTHTHVNPINLR